MPQRRRGGPPRTRVSRSEGGAGDRTSRRGSVGRSGESSPRPASWTPPTLRILRGRDTCRLDEEGTTHPRANHRRGGGACLGSTVPLAHATCVFGYMSPVIILTDILVVIGTIPSRAVSFFGCPGYKKIIVAAHIKHLPRSPASGACLFF